MTSDIIILKRRNNNKQMTFALKHDHELYSTWILKYEPFGQLESNRFGLSSTSLCAWVFGLLLTCILQVYHLHTLDYNVFIIRTPSVTILAWLCFYRSYTLGSVTASALKYLCSVGFVHRDIKPGNILVSETEVERWV